MKSFELDVNDQIVLVTPQLDENKTIFIVDPHPKWDEDGNKLPGDDVLFIPNAEWDKTGNSLVPLDPPKELDPDFLNAIALAIENLNC